MHLCVSTFVTSLYRVELIDLNLLGNIPPNNTTKGEANIEFPISLNIQSYGTLKLKRAKKKV